MKRLLIVVAACGSPAPVVPPVHNTRAEHVPRVDFSLARGMTLQLMHTSDTGVVVDRAITLRETTLSMTWAGPDPIVWFASGGFGRIGANGIERIAEPTWRRRADVVPRESDQRLETPQRYLFTAAGGQTWAAFCEWAFMADGSIICDEHVYARVDGGSTAVVDEPPERTAAPGFGNALPPMEAPPGYAATTRRVTTKTQWGDDHEYGVLTCHDPRTGFERPGPDVQDDSLGFSEPRWISRSPPLFVVDELSLGLSVTRDTQFYRGCTKTQDYESVWSGPADTVWLYGVKTEIFWHGDKVGEVDRGDIAFHVE